jgi:threonine aldolase
MIFASDNWAGASPPVLDALVRANEGAAPSYGGDAVTARVEARFREVFERDLSVFLVATGTAANALSLATLAPPWGGIVCHESAHVMEDECGAPEFYSGGAKLMGLPGEGAKIAAADLAAFLAVPRRAPHHVGPVALSLTQATEVGTAYAPDEIAALAETAHRHGLGVHMDGARFANALARLGVSPAAMTWKAGIDVLSFGATKNGCMAAEAILVFDRERAAHLAERRMRGGHLLSKSRFLAAQLEAYLADDHWLANARYANAAAARLADGLRTVPGVRLPWPTEANAVFSILPRALDEGLRAAGAVFHPWSPHGLPAGETLGPGEVLVRMVTSFATTAEEVDRFLGLARNLSRPEAAPPPRRDLVAASP